MKILYVTTSCFEKGGIGRFSRYQIQAIRELYGARNVKTMSLHGADEYALEIPFNVDWSGDKGSFYNKINFTLSAIKIARKHKPDYIHSAHINLSYLCNLLAKRYHAKSIVNIYGHEVWSRFKNKSDIGIKNADIVMSDCHYTARYVESQGFRKSGSTPVIWDCVDLTRFKTGPPPEHLLVKYGIRHPDKCFNILTLGRISENSRHKGYERLLTVFQRFVKKVNNTQLIFVGGGNYLDTLKKMTIELGLKNHVIFTDRIPEEELTTIYRCANIFSLVSDRGHGRGEGIPLTPIEAMACGIPIIVGNQDGSKEAVFENKNGWVIDPFDLEEHLNILLHAYNDKQSLVEKRKRIPEVVQRNFAYDVFKEKHRKLYVT